MTQGKMFFLSKHEIDFLKTYHLETTSFYILLKELLMQRQIFMKQ